MNIFVSDMRERIIKPCLEVLGDYSEAAENLLAGTAAQESCSDSHCCLQSSGLGIYRITPEKHRDIWDNYLIRFPELASQVRGFASQQQFLKNPHNELIGNLAYATVIAWMIYRARGIEKGMDKQKNIDANCLAQFWANYFENGTGCTRNMEDFIHSYCVATKEAEKPKLAA